MCGKFSLTQLFFFCCFVILNSQKLEYPCGQWSNMKLVELWFFLDKWQSKIVRTFWETSILFRTRSGDPKALHWTEWSHLRRANTSVCSRTVSPLLCHRHFYHSADSNFRRIKTPNVARLISSYCLHSTRLLSEDCIPRPLLSAHQ